MLMRMLEWKICIGHCYAIYDKNMSNYLKNTTSLSDCYCYGEKPEKFLQTIFDSIKKKKLALDIEENGLISASSTSLLKSHLINPELFNLLTKTRRKIAGDDDGQKMESI